MHPLILFLVLPAQGADRFVEVSGSNAGNDCTQSATPCGTIEHALSLSNSGDAVQVGAGTFSETASYPLHLRGGVDLVGAGRDRTILRATGAVDTIVNMWSPGATQVLSDLTIDAPGGGGVYALSGARVQRVDVVNFLGGIYANGDVELIDCGLESNDPFGVGIAVTSSQGTNLLLSGTTVRTPDVAALAIDAPENTRVEVVDSVLEGNPSILMTHLGSGAVSLDLLDSTVLIPDDYGVWAQHSSGQFDFTATRTEFVGGGEAIRLDAGPDTRTSLVLNEVSVDAVSAFRLGYVSGRHDVRVEQSDLVVDTPSGSVGLQVTAEDARVGMVIRDTSFEGGVVGIDASQVHNLAGILADHVSFTNVQRPLRAGGTGRIQAEIRHSTWDGGEVSVLGTEQAVVELRVTECDGTAGGPSLSVFQEARGRVVMEGTALQGPGGTGLSVVAEDDSHVEAYLIRSTLDALYEGVSIRTEDRAEMTVGIRQNRIQGIAEEGVWVQDRAGTAAITIRNNELSSTVDIRGMPSAPTSQIVATDNWWGTSDTSVILGRVVDRDDDPLAPMVSVSATDGPVLFEMTPATGMRDASAVMLLAPEGSPPLLNQLGRSHASVHIGGIPAEILGGSTDGRTLRVWRPELAPGDYTVEFVDPAGRTATAQYVVADRVAEVELGYLDWVARRGARVLIQGAPFGTGIVFLSERNAGAAACPASLQGECLHIPGPVAFERSVVLDAQGMGWVRVPARIRRQTYSFSLQGASVQGSTVQLGVPTSHVLLQPNVDDDGDGLTNDEERMAFLDAHNADSDGDGCIDPLDVAGNTPGPLVEPYDCFEPVESFDNMPVSQ